MIVSSALLRNSDGDLPIRDGDQKYHAALAAKTVVPTAIQIIGATHARFPEECPACGGGAISSAATRAAIRWAYSSAATTNIPARISNQAQNGSQPLDMAMASLTRGNLSPIEAGIICDSSVSYVQIAAQPASARLTGPRSRTRLTSASRAAKVPMAFAVSYPELPSYAMASGIVASVKLMDAP